MTEEEERERRLHADAQRRRRIEQNRHEAYDGGRIAEGILNRTSEVVTGALATALAYRTGLTPALERGLTFSSRFLNRAATQVSSKAIEDWTIGEYRQLRKGAKEAFESARKDYGKIYLDPGDHRTLFGNISTLREMMDSGDKAITNHFYRQEQIIDPTVKWFRSKTQLIQRLGGENTAKKFEDFIRQVAAKPKDRVAIFSAQKELGLLQDRQTRRVADTITRRIQSLADDDVARLHNKRRLKVGMGRIRDTAMDINKLEKQYGTARAKPDNFVSKLLGVIRGDDRAVTVRDIIQNPDRFKSVSYYTQTKKLKTERNPIDDITELAEAGKKRYGEDWYNRFLDITPDKGGMRIAHDGQLYSTEGRRKFIDSLTSQVANTLPGKILKMRDVNYSRMAPQFYYWAKGSMDPVLAALTNAQDNKQSSAVDSSLFRVYDHYYRLSDKGKLTDLGDLGGTHLYSGRFGATQHLIHQMAGDIRYKESSNKYLHWFDLFQDRDEFSGSSPLKKLRAMKDKYKDDDYIGNIIENMTDVDRRQEISDEIDMHNFSGDVDYALNYLSRTEKFRDFLDKTTIEFDRDTAKELAKHASGESQHILDVLANGTHEELEDALMNMDADIIQNKTLADMAYRLRTKRESVSGTIKQNVSRDRTNVGSSVENLIATDYGNETATYKEILRKEMSKEALLQSGYDQTMGEVHYQDMFDLIDKADLSIRQDTEARRLAHLTTFEKKADIEPIDQSDGSEMLSDQDLYDQVRQIHSILTDPDEMGQDFRKTVEEMKKEQLNWQTVHYSEPDEIGNPAHYNTWSTIRDSTSIMDVLRSMNDWEKFKSTLFQYGDQFAAGRKDMGNVSEMTLAPYFMLSRLSDEMNSVGLGFSKDNLGSTIDMVKAIALKRALPLAVGATYAEWLDDTSQEVTGMSITGAAAQGLADVDIASRKIMDTVGLTDWLKGEKALNPIMQYWGDHNEFMNAEETEKWYESGYEPVRKGAWWTFGGVNEARGSEIAYWQPSFARRIQSDWKDKSLYNGYFDKWSHSLLPTPSNPFSPIMGLLDPYWLEERHKDDRPYELTGEMFATGTPWGAILNPTVGRIFKPQKSLHEIPILGIDYRNINGVDPLSLMHAINMEIKQKARDLGGRNYIQVKGDQYTPINISEYDAPTEDSRVMSLQFKNGKVVRSDEGSFGVYQPDDRLNSASGVVVQGGSGLKALQSINDNNHIGWREAIDYKVFGGRRPLQDSIAVTNKKGQETVVNTNGAPVSQYTRSLYTQERLEIDKQINGDIDGIKGDILKLMDKYNPIKAINTLNSATKDKAASSAGKYSPDEFDPEEGVINAQKLKNYRPTDSMELLNDPDTVTELIHSGKGGDMVRDAAISWRLISGIYGYALGAATGIGVDDQKIIATGQDITSFSRGFWDENLGGAGGSVMEILRRFIPDYRRGTRVNPLLNTMPDWLPDRYHYGDPFTALPKGEMRLPGKGYESLNQLHPDQFGRYGAFDRFKILADIAPFSPEYKMWRDIAKKTVTDPDLIEEMADIRDRVNQQGKKHDFYEYKVVGRGLEYKNIVVSEVLGYGRFRSGNTIYKVAGASVRGNAQESMKDVLGRYLHVGEKVTVAVDENDAYRKNDDSIGSIDAAVFAGGENIGLQMLQNGDAKIRKGDSSAAALLANYGPMQKGIAWASEIFAHLDVPWLSDQFLRVRSPLESYKAEQVYGTPYQTWDRPIDSFLMPALERAFHDRTAFTGLIGTASRMINDIPGLTPGQSRFSKGVWLLSDRGAFIGAAVSNLFKPANGELAMKFARHGSTIATLGHFMTGGNGILDEITSGMNIGQEVARFFGKHRGIGALIGGAVGSFYRLAFGDAGDWIPKRTKKKWELEDYFDRLTYLKYMGLYQQAAKKAKEEEGVDMEDVFKQREKQAEQNKLAIGYFKKLKKQLQQNAEASDTRSQLISKLNKRIEALDADKMVIPGGEWTRTALLYKQAAESTMVGLKKNATWGQIITALPTNDREYFMEFVKERDENKRQEILRITSPFLRKALLMAWGKSVPNSLNVKNQKFFRKHQLPKENWAGWAPQYDLKDIEVKTIANEGMMLADFGFYDSQLRDPNVANAPIANFSGTTHFENERAITRNLKHVLEGRGLKDVDISVTPGPTGGGTSIIAAIKHMLGFRTVQNQVNESLSMYASE